MPRWALKQSLTTIDLRDNEIGADGAKALGEALRVNKFALRAQFFNEIALVLDHPSYERIFNGNAIVFDIDYITSPATVSKALLSRSIKS